MSSDASTDRNFRGVRADAFEALNEGLRDSDGYPLLCTWQDQHADHVGIYCNALSHLDALSDLLLYGQWCDDIVLQAKFTDDERVERLLRFYSIVFLILCECLTDMRNIVQTVSPRAKLVGDAEALMGYVNRVWKHRVASHGAGVPFHKSHHHGPYLFADSLNFAAALPDDGRYFGLGHTPAPGDGPMPLVIPSLVKAIRVVGVQVLEVSTLLEDADARGKVELAWTSGEVGGTGD